MFNKLKKRLINEMGQSFFENHKFELKGKVEKEEFGREFEFNLTQFKTTGSPNKRPDKAWAGKKRKSEKQKWQRHLPI